MTRKRPPSRATRWADAVSAARSALDTITGAKDDLAAALADLGSVKDEYQDWLDNLPDGLRDSPVGEKLQAVTALDTDAEVDTDAVESLLDEADGIDLPLGWGKD